MSKESKIEKPPEVILGSNEHWRQTEERLRGMELKISTIETKLETLRTEKTGFGGLGATVMETDNSVNS